MPLGDGTGPKGQGPGTGRRLGRCFKGPGAGRKMGGAGLGATLLTYVVQDVVRENSMIRTGIRKVIGMLSPRRKALRGPEKPDRDKIVEAEYKEITEQKEE